MSYAKVYIHVIWATKHRKPFLNVYELRTMVWKHIMENAKRHAIHIDCVNGHRDHCHCLISLSKDQSLSWVVQMIKCESARWINQNRLCETQFEWQDNYYALSISHSSVPTIRRYIYNQESHHKQADFKDESEVLMKNVFNEYPEEMITHQ